MKLIEHVEKIMQSHSNEKFITIGYLRENPNHIFVFGDNTIRKGKGGAAITRDEDNTYGFITKRLPDSNDGSYYKPQEYLPIFRDEMIKLIHTIIYNPNKTFLISKLGAGLANKYMIYEKVIKPGLHELKRYPNVEFLFNLEG